MKEEVRFRNGDIQVAGHLYRPENAADKKLPAIIVVHPGGGVKEQTAGLYAEQLAQRGFLALAYDASHQGESEGMPRFLEDPAIRVEDIRCAVDYLTTLSEVDSERIGVLGICAGGGYAINAALVEKRIKAVGTVSAVDIGGLFREAVGAPENINGLLAQISAQRSAETAGAEPLLVGYVPNSPEEITEATPEYAREAYEYYRTPRAQHPNSPNKVLFTSFAKRIAFSAFTQVKNLLTQPILLVVDSEADTKHHSEQVLAEAQTEKELFWVDGASHVALYDKMEYIAPAVEKLAAFYAAKL